MAKRRKTRAEREQEYDEADQRAWTLFEPKLAALSSYFEALKLVNDAPSPDSPGRRYYSNLGFFMQTFAPPDGSSNREKALYIQLLKKIDQEGALKPGSFEGLEQSLRRAMKS